MQKLVTIAFFLSAITQARSMELPLPPLAEVQQNPLLQEIIQQTNEIRDNLAFARTHAAELTQDIFVYCNQCADRIAILKGRVDAASLYGPHDAITEIALRTGSLLLQTTNIRITQLRFILEMV